MSKAKEKFYKDLSVAFWMGFGYAFGWAGYLIQEAETEFFTAHAYAAPRGFMFFLILAFLYAILYTVRSLMEDSNED